MGCAVVGNSPSCDSCIFDTKLVDLGIKDYKSEWWWPVSASMMIILWAQSEGKLEKPKYRVLDTCSNARTLQPASCQNFFKKCFATLVQIKVVSVTHFPHDKKMWFGHPR